VSDAAADDAADGRSPDEQAAWGFASSGESRWPSVVAVLVAIGLYIGLPNRLTPGPRFVVPVLEVLLVIPLVIANPSRLDAESRDMRWVSIALIALVNAANLTSLALLIRYLLKGGDTNGRELIRAALSVWLTQVIVFGMWYWELDRGGPIARTRADHRAPDLLFTQMTTPAVSGPTHWAPRFVDYLYVSLTNSTAFSPTDTMPLSTRIKALMGVQGLMSLATVAIVGARAVNILK